MMFKIQTLIIAFFAVFFSSCKFIMLRLYGIKNPKVENEKSIGKFAKKKNFESQIVTLNSGDFMASFKGQGIPDGAVFDKNGNYIEYRRTDTSCNAGLFDFIPALKSDGNYNKTGKTKLDVETHKFRDLKGENLSPIENADFYLLIYWTVWTGKLNKDHVNIWQDLALANKNAKIKVLLVNLDLQQHWEKSERERIISTLKNKKKK